MSLEENPKEESDTTQNVAETEGKQVKERKSRKEKVKPLAKVKVLCELFFFLVCLSGCGELINNVFFYQHLGGSSSSSANNDRRRIS